MTGEPSNKYFLRVIATLTHDSDIVSDIPSGSIYTRHIYSDILSDILSGILFGIYSDILSGICIWHTFWYFFWHSIWYIFGDSLWLRSGGEHFDPELAVEVWWGTLRSSACSSWGPTIEVRRRRKRRSRRREAGGGRQEAGGGRREAGETADIKSNNPHLTGGEKREMTTGYQHGWLWGHRWMSLPNIYMSQLILRVGKDLQDMVIGVKTYTGKRPFLGLWKSEKKKQAFVLWTARQHLGLRVGTPATLLLPPFLFSTLQKSTV